MFGTIKKFFTILAFIGVLIGVLITFFNGFIPKTNYSSVSKKNHIIEQYQKVQTNLRDDLAISEKPELKLALSFYDNYACMFIGQNCQNELIARNSLLSRGTEIANYTITHPPASAVQEAYYAFSRVGFIPRLYAAEGIGFASLSGFRNIWVVFRNISYGVLVLVMVVIAFLIMFRLKLSAQTSITIETALPRIVLSLILITFSYAIAGFMIDLMYVIMGLVITLLCNNGAYCDSAVTVDRYLTADAGDIIGSFFPYSNTVDLGPFNSLGVFFSGIKNIYALSQSLLTIMPPIVKNMAQLIGLITNVFLTFYIVAGINNAGIRDIFDNIELFTISIGKIPGGIIGFVMMLTTGLALAPFTVPFIVTIAIFLTILLLFFRIYFMLLFTYLKILLLILLAPAFMLLEAIPGQNAFVSWVKQLAGELITFPVVAGLFVLGSLIVNNFNDPALGDAISYDGAWQPPFLSSIDQKAFLMIAGMGLLFLIPDLVRISKQTVGAKELGVKFGLGTFLAGAGVGFAGGANLFGKGMNLTRMFYGQDAAKNRQGLFGLVGRLSDNVLEPIRGRPAKKGMVQRGGREVFDLVSDLGRGRFFSESFKASLSSIPLQLRPTRGRSQKHATNRYIEEANAHYAQSMAALGSNPTDEQRERATRAAASHASAVLRGDAQSVIGMGVNTSTISTPTEVANTDSQISTSTNTPEEPSGENQPDISQEQEPEGEEEQQAEPPSSTDDNTQSSQPRSNRPSGSDDWQNW